MIKLIRRLPRIRNLPTINVDNIVQYCVSVPQENDLIDIDFGSFGQLVRLPKCTQNKKAVDIWQIVEVCHPYLHVHYAEEIKPGRFQVILSAVYEERTGNLVTYHIPSTHNVDKLKNVHQWNADKFTFSRILLDDQRLEETPYIEAWCGLVETLESANRLPIFAVADLDHVDSLCREAEAACHAHPSFLSAWLDDIYRSEFGLNADAEMKTSRLLHDAPSNEIFHSSDLESHLVAGSSVETNTAKLFEQSFEDLLSKSSGIISMRQDGISGRLPYHTENSFIMAGDVILHFLTSPITNMEITYRYAASEGKLYITKGECSNELIDTKKPINLQNADEVPSNLKRWILELARLLTSRIIKPHTPKDFNLGSVKVTFADFNLVIQLFSTETNRKSLSLVLPILSVINGIPITEWKADE
jgi:hypothetical protein